MKFNLFDWAFAILFLLNLVTFIVTRNIFTLITICILVSIYLLVNYIDNNKVNLEEYKNVEDINDR